MKARYLLPLLPLLLATAKLPAVSMPDEVTVDLREPVYSDGVLTTTQGGVVRASGVRIQAQELRYTRRENETSVSAEGDILVEHGQWVFVAEKIHYDLLSKSGTLWGARTAVGPWYVGGKLVTLRSDGTFGIKGGFISTCESIDQEWQISAREVDVDTEQNVEARGIQFRFIKLPVFWFPSFRGNLKSFFDAPIRYRFGIGGDNRFLASFQYRVYQVGDWKTFLRVDYRARRGFGGGIETEYLPENSRTSLLTRSYVANDGSLFKATQNRRYRLQGTASSAFGEREKTSFTLSWDKMSDEDMPTDYQERDFELYTAERTELRLRHEESWSISNLRARVRVNNFQTVQQHLPSVSTQLRPLTFWGSGLILDTRASVGYLDTRFAQDVMAAQDFNSLRAEVNPKLYRPIHFNAVTLLPETEGVLIYYSRSPAGRVRWVGTAKQALTVRGHLYSADEAQQQTLSPYLRGEYWLTPTSQPNEHYVFDQADDYNQLSHLELGCDWALYRGGLQPDLKVKTWVDYFPGTPEVSSQLRSVHAHALWNATTTLRYSLRSSFDIARGTPGYVNLRSEWTASRDLAIAAEFRHRNAYTWRKADPRRFMMESFVPEDALRASKLSDRRQTILGHVYWKMNPWLAFEWKSRHGFGRSDEPGYFDFQTGLHATLRCTWRVSLLYSQQEHDQRFGIYVQLQDHTPSR